MDLSVSDIEVKGFIVSREINSLSKYVKTMCNSGYVEIDLWTTQATLTYSNN